MLYSPNQVKWLKVSFLLKWIHPVFLFWFLFHLSCLFWAGEILPSWLLGGDSLNQGLLTLQTRPEDVHFSDDKLEKNLEYAGRKIRVFYCSFCKADFHYSWNHSAWATLETVYSQWQGLLAVSFLFYFFGKEKSVPTCLQQCRTVGFFSAVLLKLLCDRVMFLNYNVIC